MKPEIETALLEIKTLENLKDKLINQLTIDLEKEKPEQLFYKTKDATEFIKIRKSDYYESIGIFYRVFKADLNAMTIITEIPIAIESFEKKWFPANESEFNTACDAIVQAIKSL